MIYPLHTHSIIHQGSYMVNYPPTPRRSPKKYHPPRPSTSYPILITIPYKPSPHAHHRPARIYSPSTIP